MLNPGIPYSQLQKRTGCPNSTIQHIIERLDDAGLIKRLIGEYRTLTASCVFVPAAQLKKEIRRAKKKASTTALPRNRHGQDLPRSCTFFSL